MSQDLYVLVILKPVTKQIRNIAYEVTLHSLGIKLVSLFWINMNISTTKNPQV